jgi:WD40 repeat protein
MSPSIRETGQPTAVWVGRWWAQNYSTAMASVLHCLSPDGHTLAVGSDDRTVLLWDLSDRTHPRRLGQPLTGHSDDVLSVAFSSDGRTLASGSHDETVLLWDLLELEDLRRHAAERACSLTQRGLDHDEWVRYIPDLPYQSTCPS